MLAAYPSALTARRASCDFAPGWTAKGQPTSPNVPQLSEGLVANQEAQPDMQAADNICSTTMCNQLELEHCRALASSLHLAFVAVLDLQECSGHNATIGGWSLMQPIMVYD